MLDILVFAVKVIGDDNLKAGYETFSSHPEFVATCAELAGTYYIPFFVMFPWVNEKISTFVDKSKRNPFIAIDKSASIAKLISQMNNSKVHRVATVDSAGNLQDLVTQSAVVEFIAEHSNEVPFAKKTVEEMKLGYRKVITVPQTQTCFSGFSAIVENGVSGVGVVDANGKLISNLSASDIKVSVWWML